MSYKCRSPCKSSKKNKQPKERNWIAVHAFQRSGAGAHTDKKKKRNKRACRGKIKYENETITFLFSITIYYITRPYWTPLLEANYGY